MALIQNKRARQDQLLINPVMIDHIDENHLISFIINHHQRFVSRFKYFV